MYDFIFLVLPLLCAIVIDNSLSNEVKTKYIDSLNGNYYKVIFISIIAYIFSTQYFYKFLNINNSIFNHYDKLLLSTLVGIIGYITTHIIICDVSLKVFNRHIMRFGYIYSNVTIIYLLLAYNYKDTTVMLWEMGISFIFWLLLLLFTNIVGASDCRLLMFLSPALILYYQAGIVFIIIFMLIVAMIYQHISQRKISKKKRVPVPVGQVFSIIGFIFVIIGPFILPV